MHKSKIKVYNIDATGKSLGRMASDIATLLRGKREVSYLPYMDPMVTVKVINIDKVSLTGKKIYKKIYRYHTGYPGGLRTVKYSDFIKKDKGKALRTAVLRMLNKSKMRSKIIKRLVIS